MKEVIKEGIHFPSRDTKHECVGDVYIPSVGKPQAVLQVVHGMVEHFGCYELFANTLAKRGIIVCGIDHTGHGRSCPNPEEYGTYDPHNGADHLVEDQAELTRLMKERFSGIPYFILGHSMGSFVTRCYLQEHSDLVDGAFILGTGWQPGYMIKAGAAITKTIAAFRGWNYRSKFVDNLGCGGYNKAFEGTGAKTGYEWLSRDENKALAYANDELCGWTFSVSGYYMISHLLRRAQDAERIAKIRKDLPIMVISGTDDPVGNAGAGPASGPIKVYETYQEAGIRDVSIKLIEGARHEVLHEIDKFDTMDDIYTWIVDHIDAE